MKLEEIVNMYGWNDYLDQNTGYIYQLSTANKNLESHIAYVNVKDSMTNEPIGTAVMDI